MDPLTGFSRRTTLFLALIVVVGIAASTVATVLEARSEPGCPDRAYGCAVIEPGQPVRLGVLYSARRRSTSLGEVLPAEQADGMLLGHRLQIARWDDGCSTEGGAEGAREIATDPPDGPPVVGVVGAGCSASALVAAQILSDRGIVLLSTELPEQVPARSAFHLSADRSPAETVEAMLDAVEQVVTQHEGDLLVPRTHLRDALLSRGFARAS